MRHPEEEHIYWKLDFPTFAISRRWSVLGVCTPQRSRLRSHGQLTMVPRRGQLRTEGDEAVRALTFSQRASGGASLFFFPGEGNHRNMNSLSVNYSWESPSFGGGL